MKKLFVILFLFFVTINQAFAAEWTWFFWQCTDVAQIRNWEINFDTLLCLLWNTINILIWIAWTISVIFIIIWWYQIIYGWLTWSDMSKWKTTVVKAIFWFVIAVSSYIIVSFVFDNFTKL